MSGSYTRGVVFVHSCPPALCPHVEWNVASVLDQEVRLEWTQQGAVPGLMRAEFSWVGPVGTGAQLASALRGWDDLRYEITEEAVRGSDGARWCHTPDLGIFHAPMDASGNMMVPEDRIRFAMEATDPAELRERLNLALGGAWDEELEPFRYAGDGVAVRWLHRVG
ncbi:DUF3145 domain-containing protein [Gleimia europaea]|uniref:DUF3145 domain-containing protein n=1 Tax=Gleimia europaea ACS-120-V-Col10b TaxID=883069 RepID=A0A9W5RCQ2_9ACTO|nr:DUF3145 domain-containing protein [Gleimia europaea]EPD29379.1 hypothetical protein HMPREF9238_01695 [Gleimia europaea ACS-120-V-Col10b]